MSKLLDRLKSSRQLRWIVPALVVDWLVVVILNLISTWVDRQYPYERDPARYLDDPSLQWPVTKERVPAGPNTWLDVYTFWIPIAVVVLVGAGVKRSFHDVHHGILVFLSSRALMRIIVECLKNRVRRLRALAGSALCAS